jgi:DNA-binding beta-propeller fold protein YncE
MKQLVRKLFLPVFLLLSILQLQAQETAYKFYKHIPANDNLRWDYLAADVANRHLFVSHQAKVLIIDMDKDEIIGEIANTRGVHGIAIASKLNKGFISNGATASVTVFDLTTLKTIDTIPGTGANPDAILYDTYTNQVFTFNGKSNNATVIDPVGLKIIGTVDLPGKPEFAASDEKGNLYVNIEDKSLIVEIDAKTLKTKKQWPISPGSEASGMAIDRKNKLLFSVCDKILIVSDYAQGKVLTTATIGNGPDAVVFDPETKLIYSSNGEGTVTILKQSSKEKYEIMQTLATQKGCRTIGFDNKTKKIYLSAAKFEDNSRKMIPNSFEVLVYQR